MNDVPKELRRLLWADEELDDSERARLEAYLEAHPEAGELRDTVRGLESSARNSPAIPPLDDAVYELSGEEARQERFSYHAVMRRLRGSGAGAVRAGGRAGRRWGGWFRWALPVAVAAAVALVWMGDFRGDGGVSDLAVLRVDREGITRSGDEAEVWRSGDAFSLEAHFARGVVPFVFLVDPVGVPSMLHPPPGGDATPVDRGGILRFPAAGSGEIWVLGRETGPETFLVVAGRAESPAPAELAARAESLAGADRATVLAAVIDLLEAEAGPVSIVEIDHRP